MKGKTCCDIRRCSASAYLTCEARERGLSCWETTDRICCRRKDLGRCRECEVYLESEGFSPEEIQKILVEIRRASRYNRAWSGGDRKEPSAPKK